MKLESPPSSFTAAVVVAYASLSWRGAQHLYDMWRQGASEDLLRDFVLMLLLYAFEVAGAVVFGVTALYRWTRTNFLEHHLPLIVVAASLYSQNTKTQYRATLQHQEWMALVLLICINEATAGILTLWPNAKLERWRVAPNMLVQLLLLAFETTSWLRATRLQLAERDPAMWFSTFLSQFLLVSAAVHIYYFKGLSKVFITKCLGVKLV